MWDFLNQNLISNLLSGILFGVIAVIVISYYDFRKEYHRVTNQILTLIRIELEDNLKLAKNANKMLSSYRVALDPFLFSTACFSIASRTRFIEFVNPEITITFVSLYRDFKTINNIIRDLQNFTFGIQSALQGAPEIRKRIIEKLKRDLLRIENSTAMIIDIIDKGYFLDKDLNFIEKLNLKIASWLKLG